MLRVKGINKLCFCVPLCTCGKGGAGSGVVWLFFILLLEEGPSWDASSGMGQEVALGSQKWKGQGKRPWSFPAPPPCTSHHHLACHIRTSPILWIWSFEVGTTESRIHTLVPDRTLLSSKNCPSYRFVPGGTSEGDGPEGGPEGERTGNQGFLVVTPRMWNQLALDIYLQAHIKDLCHWGKHGFHAHTHPSPSRETQ